MDAKCFGPVMNPNWRIPKKCGVSDAKRRFTIENCTFLLILEEPAISQVRSVSGYIQWAAQMCHWVRPFLADIYSCFNLKNAEKSPGAISDRELCMW